MANFFGYTAVYADGHTETADGIRLWMLGGRKDEVGHALLAELRQKEKDGIITRLSIYYES